MPRLTFEALMAPGGLMDSGSRLTQTLVETPLKREQLRQGIREQELGRAEQAKIRSEAFAREDKIRTEQNTREDARVGKAGRIDYYKGRVNAADAHLQLAIREASDAFEKRMTAKYAGAGASASQMEIVKQAVEIVKSKLANPALVEGIQSDPTLIGRTMDQAMAAVNAQFKSSGLLTPELSAMAMSSQAAGLDPQMKDEIERATKSSVDAWDLYRKEVGAADNRVEAQRFMQNNGMGTETYGLPKEKTAAAGAAPAESIVTKADTGAVDPNETDLARKQRLYQESINAERATARAGTIAPSPVTGAPAAEPSGIPFEERSRAMARQLQGIVPAVADASGKQADMLTEAQRIMAQGRGTPGSSQDKAFAGAANAVKAGPVQDPRIAQIVESIAKQTNLAPDARAVFDDIVAKEFGANNFTAAEAQGGQQRPAYLQGLPANAFLYENRAQAETMPTPGLGFENAANMAMVQAPLLDMARRANIIAASARTRKPLPDMVAYNPFVR